MAPNVSSSDAVVLAPNDLMRFLPNYAFKGTVSIQLTAWDESDSLAHGSRVDLTLPGATGGSTAYSTAGTTATLAVSASVPPSFSLISTSTMEDNTVAASGGTSGGTNPNVLKVPNFASNIVPGDGGGSLVTFNVSDAYGNFGTLFSQAPAIDSQGTLTYQLNPDQYGTAHLDVTANNGLASTVQQTTISVAQINDPPTLGAITSPRWVLDTAGQQTVNLSGISGGYDEPLDLVSVHAAATPRSGDNAGLIYNLSTTYEGGSVGTVNYTPYPGQNGTLQVTVTVTDSGGLTATQTFVVTVYSEPSYYLNTTGIDVANTAGTQTVANLAESIEPGYPNSSASFSVTNTNNSVFTTGSGQPWVDTSGTLHYTPAPGQHGDATVSVTINNSVTGLSSTQSFSLYVVAAPTANPDIYVINASGASSVSAAQGLLANDVNPNSGLTVASGVNGTPAYGGLASNSDGSFTYTPNSGFKGFDQFSYADFVYPTVSNTATVTVYSHGGALVAKMYQQMLNRAASGSDVEGWAPSVDSSLSNVATVDGGIYKSNEYESAQITKFYEEFLFRTPSSSETTNFENIWQANSDQGPPQVIIDIADSAECFNDESDNYSNWVTLIYNAILSRSPSSTELNYWVGELQSGMTRQTAVTYFVTGDEYRDDVIKSFFETFLQRAASSSDISYYQGLMDNNGYTQLQVQQAIVQSGEYTGNPAAPSTGVADPWSGPSGY